jgi:hypothetical protein
MPPQTLRLTDPVEALVVEQALAMLRQLRQTTQNAPPGHVLAQAELVAVAQGRELTRQALQAVLNETPCPAEKKGCPSGAAPVKRSAKARGKHNAQS